MFYVYLGLSLLLSFYQYIITRLFNYLFVTMRNGMFSSQDLSLLSLSILLYISFSLTLLSYFYYSLFLALSSFEDSLSKKEGEMRRKRERD